MTALTEVYDHVQVLAVTCSDHLMLINSRPSGPGLPPHHRGEHRASRPRALNRQGMMIPLLLAVDRDPFALYRSVSLLVLDQSQDSAISHLAITSSLRVDDKAWWTVGRHVGG